MAPMTNQWHLWTRRGKRGAGFEQHICPCIADLMFRLPPPAFTPSSVLYHFLCTRRLAKGLTPDRMVNNQNNWGPQNAPLTPPDTPAGNFQLWYSDDANGVPLCQFPGNNCSAVGEQAGINFTQARDANGFARRLPDTIPLPNTLPLRWPPVPDAADVKGAVTAAQSVVQQGSAVNPLPASCAAIRDNDYNSNQDNGESLGFAISGCAPGSGGNASENCCPPNWRWASALDDQYGSGSCLRPPTATNATNGPTPNPNGWITCPTPSPAPPAYCPWSSFGRCCRNKIGSDDQGYSCCTSDAKGDFGTCMYGKATNLLIGCRAQGSNPAAGNPAGVAAQQLFSQLFPDGGLQMTAPAVVDPVTAGAARRLQMEAKLQTYSTSGGGGGPDCPGSYRNPKWTNARLFAAPGGENSPQCSRYSLNVEQSGAGLPCQSNCAQNTLGAINVYSNGDVDLGGNLPTLVEMVSRVLLPLPDIATCRRRRRRRRTALLFMIDACRRPTSCTKQPQRWRAKRETPRGLPTCTETLPAPLRTTTLSRQTSK